MKKQTALTLGTCLCLMSLGVTAQTVVDGDVESSGDGYVSAGGMVLKTGLGECLQTGTLSEDNTINKCAGIEDEVAETEAEGGAEEVEQAAVEKAPAAPAPTPTINTREFSELALFEFGSASLNDEGSMVMGELIEVAAAIRSRFPNAKIDAVGMGESSPAASNDTAEGRQQNRRVEVEITASRMTLN